MLRSDGRKVDQLRPIKFYRNYLKYPEGSVLVEMGQTRVICTASVVEEVPHFLKEKEQGWITAEYSLLPRSTDVRTGRDRVRSAGRTREIQRLIGRSLRSVVNLNALGPRTIYLDCDVIQADGGTRTASINGAFLALGDAFRWLREREEVNTLPFTNHVAAISAGIVEKRALLDLNFSEDFSASVDLNLVMTEKEELVEIQGTGEDNPFSLKQLEEMLYLSRKGIKEIINLQKEAMGLN